MFNNNNKLWKAVVKILNKKKEASKYNLKNKVKSNHIQLKLLRFHRQTQNNYNHNKY